NLMLAEVAHLDDLEEEHRVGLAEWVTTLDLAEVKHWDLAELWSLTRGQGHTITPQAQTFVAAWRDEVLARGHGIRGADAVPQLGQRPDTARKGRRARFTNARHGHGALPDRTTPSRDLPRPRRRRRSAWRRRPALGRARLPRLPPL